MLRNSANFKNGGESVDQRSIQLSYGRKRVEPLRQKVARLNTKVGKAILFVDFARCGLESVGVAMKRSSRVRREAAIHAIVIFLLTPIIFHGKPINHNISLLCLVAVKGLD